MRNEALLIKTGTVLQLELVYEVLSLYQLSNYIQINKDKKILLIPLSIFPEQLRKVEINNKELIHALSYYIQEELKTYPSNEILEINYSTLEYNNPTEILNGAEVLLSKIFPEITKSVPSDLIPLYEKGIPRQNIKKRYEILKEQNWKCKMCGCKLKYGKKSAKEWNKDFPTAHIDHIWPYSKRFTYPKGAHNINEKENYQALCGECNTKFKKSKVWIQ